MNKRKQHVIDTAYQLFIEKGFQATSIQEIIDSSGISKGTFYNYFSSKSELLISIFKWLHDKLEHERNQLLIGQDLSDIEVFIKQIILQMKTNKRNQMLNLYREIFVSNDQELVQFIKQRQLYEIRWTMERLIDILGEEKKPYLLDCSIMFTGILHQNFQFSNLENKSNLNADHIIRYSVARLLKIVEEVSEAGESLLDPDLLEKWLPDTDQKKAQFREKFLQYYCSLKNEVEKHIQNNEEREKLLELLDFVKEEMIDAKEIRKFVIISALQSIETNLPIKDQKDFQRLQKLINGYLQ